MAVDAVVCLDQLRCVRDHDGTGRSEPYAWTAMVTGDAGTLSSGAVQVSTPATAVAVPVALPPAPRQFTHRIDSGGFIGIVVALLDRNELPGHALIAGYQTFRTEVGLELGAFLRTHHRAPTDGEQADLGERIRRKVIGSIHGVVSFGGKVAVVTGLPDQDDPVTIDAAFTGVGRIGETQPFALTFQTKARHYQLTGRFRTCEPALIY